MSKSTSASILAIATISTCGCQGYISLPGGGGSDSRHATAGPLGADGVNGNSGTVTPGVQPDGKSFDPKVCTLPQKRITQLTPSQYDKTIQALLPGASSVAERLGETLGGRDETFSNDDGRLLMSLPHVTSLFQVATDLAKQALGTAQLPECWRAEAPAATCINDFVSSFAGQAFRRTLSAEEISRYAGYLTSETALRGADVALEQLVRVVLLDAEFLFRTELGDETLPAPPGAVALTAAERAAAISYLVTDGPPDAELARAELSTPDQVEAQLRQLVTEASSQSGLKQFFLEHLRSEGVRHVTKDPILFAEFDSAVADASLDETKAFLDSLLGATSATFRNLLTADYGYVNIELSPLYGVQSVSSSPVRAPLPAGQRAGVLTQVSLLARLARPQETAIVARGRFVRERLLCDPPPPPPPNVNAAPPPPDPTLTGRERMAAHVSSACAGCHSLLDPLGFAFEGYDAIGRYRTTENGKPIDATGSFEDSGKVVAFDGAVQLGDALASSPTAQTCMVRQVYRYAHGGAEGKADACAIDDIASQFIGADGNIRDLVVQLVRSDSFLFRAR